jgi:hypothetical protein
MHYKRDDGGFSLFEPLNEDAKAFSQSKFYQQHKLEMWQQETAAAKVMIYQLMMKLWSFSIVLWGGLFYWSRVGNTSCNRPADED